MAGLPIRWSPIAYVKYSRFHMEQRPRFNPDPFKAENFHCNEEHDFCICPMGQKMRRTGTKRVKTASGYVSENARYRAVRCEGCPLRCRYFNAKGNRMIELNHRLRRYRQKAKGLLCSGEGLKHRGQSHGLFLLCHCLQYKKDVCKDGKRTYWPAD